jgi:predicted MFS family arabinose efflux permease
MTGFGVALTAVVQGEYISLCANERTKGFYFGYFFAINQTSIVVGNLVGSILILKTSGPSFFLIMGLIMFVGMTGFCFLKKISKDDDVKNNQVEPVSFKEGVGNVFRLMIDKKMLHLTLYLLWSGCSIAYWQGIIPPILKLQLNSSDDEGLSENELTSKALQGMILLGVGECLGSLGSGFIIDAIGSKKTCILNVVLIVLCAIVVTMSTNSLKYNSLSFIMCFLWGVQDATNMSNTM